MIARAAPIQLSSRPLEFDFQATTPCAAEVVAAMAPFWSEHWGNPSSRQHRLGLSASAAVKLARRQMADALGVTPERLLFTSGATEANNLALLGHARALARQRGRPGHLISIKTEHHAVLDPLKQLQREGFSVSLLQPDSQGLITPSQLEAALTDTTDLVSVMAANNEIGVLQPLKALAELCHASGVTLHSDAAQAFGHIELKPDQIGLDLMSISAHKLNGPKGIGALLIRDSIALEPLQWGGGQEQGLRPGTLPTPLIVGMARATTLAMADLPSRTQRLRQLRNDLWEGLRCRIPGLLLNGALEPRLAHNLNITVPGVSGSRLHRALRPTVACSSGSACSNGAPSHVLQAIGRSRREAEASLRLSLGRETTEADVLRAIDVIPVAVADARS